MGITDIQFPLSLFSENRDKAILANREFMDEEEQIAMTATEYGYTPQHDISDRAERQQCFTKRAMGI